MKISPDLILFTASGRPTFQHSAGQLAAVVDYVLDQVAMQTGWTNQQIVSKLDPYRFLWGQSVRKAIVDMIHGCQAHDRFQR